jgi:hypothetical protein
MHTNVLSTKCTFEAHRELVAIYIVVKASIEFICAATPSLILISSHGVELKRLLWNLLFIVREY